MKRCCQAISALCQGFPLLGSEKVQLGVFFLCEAVSKRCLKNQAPPSNIYWAICNHMKHVCIKRADLLPFLIPQAITICDGRYRSNLPIIIILGQLSYTVELTDMLIKFNALSLLHKFLKNPIKIIRRETCWILSNISAGTLDQVSAIINEMGLIKTLADLLENDIQDVKQQICLVFANLAFQGDIYEEHNIAGLHYRLLEQKQMAVEIALKCLWIILGFAKNTSQHAFQSLIRQLIMERRFDILDKLQCQSSDIITDFAEKLVQIMKESIQDN